MMPEISRHLICYSSLVFITSAQIEFRNFHPPSAPLPPSHRAINLFTNFEATTQSRREDEKEDESMGVKKASSKLFRSIEFQKRNSLSEIVCVGKSMPKVDKRKFGYANMIYFFHSKRFVAKKK